ncbi:MAG: diacylglycerol kinase [Trueperaceae bacterium]|nr:diacylglycerol kinase [Trueperaceae bacterium]
MKYAWRNEPNFRIELTIAVLAFLLSLWLKVSPVAILVMTALVLALELLNSALEATIDLISPDFHPLAKLAKDAAAGAVLLTSFLAVLVGLFALGPALLTKLGLL